MRITSVLLILLTVAYFIQGFNAPKCKHVYVTVEQAEIKVEVGPTWVHAIYEAPPSGVQDGQDIICVKCSHQRKQKIDYGQPDQRRSMVWPSSPLNITWETCKLTTIGSAGGLTLKVDSTIQWSKVDPVK